jgi:uncharacterized membrane protein
MRSAMLAIAGAAGAALAQPTYTIADLTELAAPLGVAQCEGRAINDAGQIVGFELLPEFRAQAIFWDADGTPRLLPTLEGDNSTTGFAITADGDPLGVSDHVRIEMVGHQLRIFQDEKAALWRDGAAVDIETLITSGPAIDLQVAHAAGVEATASWIAGDGRSLAGPPFEPFGWVLRDGELTTLGALQRPRAINRRGVIVGHTAGSQSKAHMWERGAVTNLHDHPAIGGVKSEAWDINSGGAIVGEAQFHISQPESACLWEHGEPVNLLAPHFGRPQSLALAIDDAGNIVGYVNDLDVLTDETRAFILLGGAGGAYHDLIDLVPEAHAQGWDQLIVAFDINSRGQIVGGGRRHGQLGHGFLLTPLCRADLTGDGVLDFFDFLAFQNLFAAGDLRADFTGDGVLDFFDFLAFQDEFAAGCA